MMRSGKSSTANFDYQFLIKIMNASTYLQLTLKN